MHDEAMQNGLQEALDLRMEREQALARVRTELDGLTTQLRGMGWQFSKGLCSIRSTRVIMN